MRGAVDLRHRRVWVVGQDVCVLRPLEFVEELCPQHDVEIFPDTGNDLIHSKFPWSTENTRLSPRLCRLRTEALGGLTCCLSSLWTSCSWHNLQALRPRSFWQVGGKAADRPMQMLERPWIINKQMEGGRRYETHLFLPCDQVPVVHKPRFEFLWDFDFHLHSVYESLLLCSHKQEFIKRRSNTVDIQ